MEVEVKQIVEEIVEGKPVTLQESLRLVEYGMELR